MEKKNRSVFMCYLSSAPQKNILISIILLLSAIIYIVSPNPSRAESIIYISDKWDVSFISDVFIRGSSVILCAGTDNKKYYMIDPFSDMARPANKNCKTPNGYTAIQPNLVKLYDPTNLEMANAIDYTQVFSYNTNPNHCELNFSDSYKVFYRDGTKAEFVILGRSKKPVLYSLRAGCENADGVERHIYQDIIEVNPILYNVINDNEIIFYGLNSILKKQFIVLLSEKPSRAISLDGDNFIIPIDIINKIMLGAGSDVKMRQNALSKFIASIPLQSK